MVRQDKAAVVQQQLQAAERQVMKLQQQLQAMEVVQVLGTSTACLAPAGPD